MKNFLSETLREIKRTKHTPENVMFVQYSDDPYDDYSPIHQISFKDFMKFANEKYDGGYGSVYINLSLKIVFDDQSWLERAEYDGAEWWDYKKVPEFKKFETDLDSIPIFNKLFS